MKTFWKVLSIIFGTLLLLKGVQLLVDYLYRRCCNSYIEADCANPF